MGEYNRTMAEVAMIAEDASKKMKVFQEQIYAGMAKGMITKNMKNLKYNPQDETFTYWEEPEESLVPDSAVALVDGMF